MSALIFLVRTGLRRSLSSLVLLVLLVGVAGGAVLAAWAGARRTDTAYPRLLDRTNNPDVVVDALADIDRFDPELVRDAPGVEQVSIGHGFGALPMQDHATPDFTTGFFFTAAADDVMVQQIAQPVLLEGRLPDPADPREVLVNTVTRDSHAGVGDTLNLCVFNFDAIEGFERPVGDPTEDDIRRFVDEVCAVHGFEVVGVARFSDEVAAGELNEGQAFIVATPAFAGDPGTPRSYDFALVDLRPGADAAAFDAYVRERADPAAGVQVQLTTVREVVVQRTTRPYVGALLVFAVVAAITAVGVLGPAVSRFAATPESDRLALVAMGVRPLQLRLAAGLRGAVAGTFAAGLAVTIAILASPMFPVGPIRAAEPLGGIRADVPVAVTGAVVIVLLGFGLGAVAGIRKGPSGDRPAILAERLAAAGAPPSAVVGLSNALGSRSGERPVAAAFGVAVAASAVVAALAFEAGLARLLDTPARYGFVWDATYEAYDADPPPDVLAFLEGDPSVTAASLGQRASITVDGATVPAFAFEDLRGSVRPVIVDGRSPEGPSELALGGQTMARLGLQLGDSVAVQGSDAVREIDATVVGKTLLPILHLGHDLSIGEGALAPAALLDGVGGGTPGFVLIDLSSDRTVDDLRNALSTRGFDDAGDASVLGPTYTVDLIGYDRVRSTPLFLAGLLAVLGAGVLTHTLLSAASANGRQFAVLKSIGFERRELAATMRWHAVALVTACLVVAIPVGLAAGRGIWSAFARDLGVADDAVLPVVAVCAVIAGTILVALVLAAVPGRRAASVRPAAVLRSE